MAFPVLTWALRVSLRRTDSALRMTRDFTELGITAVQLAGRVLGVAAETGPMVVPSPPPRAPAPAKATAVKAHGNGAGTFTHVAAPFAGYEELLAADVIARLPGSDTATLGAIELYESTHRGRRTVLDAVTRQARRRS